ncbi:MAG: hypothetical protein HOH43_10040 [Candidatus Latescibacteria bacterium]|nr:hypothetical protein [Candidatus Latescibacterota bacterium]
MMKRYNIRESVIVKQIVRRRFDSKSLALVRTFIYNEAISIVEYRDETGLSNWQAHKHEDYSG